MGEEPNKDNDAQISFSLPSRFLPQKAISPPRRIKYPANSPKGEAFSEHGSFSGRNWSGAKSPDCYAFALSDMRAWILGKSFGLRKKREGEEGRGFHRKAPSRRALSQAAPFIGHSTRGKIKRCAGAFSHLDKKIKRRLVCSRRFLF